MKKNMMLAIEIIHRCFNENAPKSVQKIGKKNLKFIRPLRATGPPE